MCELAKMRPESPTDLSTQQVQQHVICVSSKVNDHPNSKEIARDLEQLGGVKVPDGYVFADAVQQDVALDIISDKYGARYFEAVKKGKHQNE